MFFFWQLMNFITTQYGNIRFSSETRMYLGCLPIASKALPAYEYFTCDFHFRRRSIYNYKMIQHYFITFSIFSHSKHNFKSEFHYAFIQFTNLHLVKILTTLNLMSIHQNKLKYEEVIFFFLIYYVFDSCKYIKGVISL
jgi:hypothetical protein